MAILLNNHGYDNQSWYQALSAQLPAQPIYLYSELQQQPQLRETIEYAVVWDHPQGDLINYPNLKGILLLGAGTEAIDRETQLPDVPVVRLIDPEVINDMAAYALYWVMHSHRRYGTYRQQQADKVWLRHDLSASADYRVTVLGLGVVGKTVATTIANLGYQVSGWDRYAQQLDAVHCHHGTQQLPSALQHCDVLINCLPVNTDTYHFIDQSLLSQLPSSATLINISRGDVIDSEALLRQLDRSALDSAVLDAFSIEPLPADSPFWQHPKITVTPHMSGATYARSAATLVADNIKRIQRGEQPYPLHVPALAQTVQKAG